jgi:hypothetical protein
MIITNKWIYEQETRKQSSSCYRRQCRHWLGLDTYADALSEGYKLFKLEPFLVKQIQAVETAHFIARAAQGRKKVCPISRSSFK